MNRGSLFLVIAGLLSPLVGHAAGVNLRWDQCLGDGGVPNKAFACNTNNGARAMVASFVIPAAMTSFAGEEVIVDLATAAPSLPNWWQFFNAGSCRQNSLVVNANVSPTAVNCVD